jgi:TonB-dependent SusC/RagA subfamily outer membrane receptor
MLYVVGSEQKLHFQQIFKTLEILGYDWQKKCSHVNFGLIYLPEGGKMSTRKGEIVFMEEVVEKIISMARKLITSEIPEKEKDPDQSILQGIHGEPDNVIYVDEKMANYNNIFDIIKGRVPGVLVYGDKIQIRGPNSFILSTEPLYLIDDIPVDANAVSSLNPQDVERIEFLKGPSAAIYGSRGANGVIAIYTKRGIYMKKGILESQILGFYRPREFYSPKYETRLDYMKPDDRITLFWAPSIILDSVGQAEAVFYSSDIKGTFDITIEGITFDGEIGESTATINIE